MHNGSFLNGLANNFINSNPYFKNTFRSQKWNSFSGQKIIPFTERSMCTTYKVVSNFIYNNLPLKSSTYTQKAPSSFQPTFSITCNIACSKRNRIVFTLGFHILSSHPQMTLPAPICFLPPSLHWNSLTKVNSELSVNAMATFLYTPTLTFSVVLSHLPTLSPITLSFFSYLFSSFSEFYSSTSLCWSSSRRSSKRSSCFIWASWASPSWSVFCHIRHTLWTPHVLSPLQLKNFLPSRPSIFNWMSQRHLKIWMAMYELIIFLLPMSHPVLCLFHEWHHSLSSYTRHMWFLTSPPPCPPFPIHLKPGWCHLLNSLGLSRSNISPPLLPLKLSYLCTLSPSIPLVLLH